MKYEFDLRARPTGDDPTATKHPLLVKSLKTLSGDWIINVTQFGKLDMAPPCGGCSMTRAMPKGVTARVSYNYKSLLDDDAQFDDHLSLSFNPLKINLHQLYDEVIPMLINIFSAYYLEITDDETYVKDQMIDVRRQIGRLGLVNFFDKLLCDRAFGMTPAAVVKAVKKDVAEAKTLHDGVYIVLSKDILGPKEIQEQGKLVRNLLPNSPFKK